MRTQAELEEVKAALDHTLAALALGGLAGSEVYMTADSLRCGVNYALGMEDGSTLTLITGLLVVYRNRHPKEPPQ